MRAFLTGGTGFIGSHVARVLVTRGWNVVALVRSPERASHLREMGVTLVGGDITEPATLAAPMRRCDAVFHLAAWYQIGVTERQAMWATNVTGTENVLQEAALAGVTRIVYCSSVAALGPGAPGEIRDETSIHPGNFPTAYEETKWRAHLIAREMIRAGLPVVTVMPGATYGPGDQSVLGMILRYYARGWLVAMPRLSVAFSWVHVDDLAEGIVLAHDKARDGEEYVLGGDNAAVSDLFRRLEPLTGIRPPRLRLPGVMIRAARPLGPLISRALRQPSRFIEEGVASLEGSYMASSAKAQRELGYAFRSVEEGLPETITWLKEH